MGRNIEAKQRSKVSSDVLLGNHIILEKDNIPSLYSHGQVLKQTCCFPCVLAVRLMCLPI